MHPYFKHIKVKNKINCLYFDFTCLYGYVHVFGGKIKINENKGQKNKKVNKKSYLCIIHMEC